MELKPGEVKCAKCSMTVPIGDDPKYPGWPHLRTPAHMQGKDGRVNAARPGEGECRYCCQTSEDRYYGVI